MDGHQFRGARIYRDMMLVSSVCRRALGCEWGGGIITSSSIRPARDGWPAARKRARTPRVPQGGREARAPQRRSYTAY